MNKKNKIYMSVEEGFYTTPEYKYRTSKNLVNKLNEQYDLTLVVPSEYNIDDMTINSGYKLIDDSVEKVLGEHNPEGDMFIIYGDETSKNKGLAFGRNQYKFLRGLETSKKFGYFFNKPDVEEATLKDKLVDLGKKYSGVVANTFFYESDDQLREEFSKYGSIVLKPVFGCASAGVRKFDSFNEFKSVELKHPINEYIFQEPLEGSETRVILLDGNYIGSRTDFDYMPWSNKNPKTFLGDPNDMQLESARILQKELGADLIGVDFMGDKIYELNGTGTGLISYDHNNNLIFDYTENFIKFINSKLR